ncbi:hypothetical protein [Chryseobacterium rhizosphaerae]|uniref:Uncharacterized protein n=1 Tax=Chryseobacterium rhizosphaerae TaxID=395937 RepID=A0ABX9IHG9_9FLAO|nr:hypothetical protein [Chryseobacterium rhizosphaerae]MDC8101947.1 hypothetical protein [Chryseobacterium rhizosphaerae]MDR6548351.1 hypothetical protein [Chryseobacterium rhizosphaerae]REC73793.1 hypothetical protein DRF57_15760 [Chryseobacterium rhizosphaerae]GEN67888.1 hypothetical protein CRH01_24560 [Chryseobacterium rhizosphaerae]
MNHFDDFKILNALSEQLCEDHCNKLVLDREFMNKMDDIRIKMQEALKGQLNDLDGFAKSLGYVIIRTPNPTLVSCKGKKFKINRN